MSTYEAWKLADLISTGEWIPVDFHKKRKLIMKRGRQSTSFYFNTPGRDFPYCLLKINRKGLNTNYQITWLI